MHFFTQAGLAAAMAGAAYALPAIVTDVEVAVVTDIIYVNAAGQTLSEAAMSETTSTAASPSVAANAFGADWHSHGKPSSASTTSIAVAATPTTSSTTTTPAAPATTMQTSASTSASEAATSVAPVTTSTSAAAPTTTAASGGSPTGCADWSSFTAAAESLCSGASDMSYCVGAVGATNMHRANHSVSPLAWNNTLAGWAQTHTDQCVFQDYLTDDGTYHQSNAYVGYGMPGDGEAATHTWYNSEEPLFASANLWGIASPPSTVDGSEIGHFANVVWKEWTSMGCATTLCSSVAGMTNANLTLCFYSDYTLDNDYATNVMTPIGCPTYPTPGAQY